MKKIILLIALIVYFVDLSATTYTSNSNGNWSSPTIWTPAGVPQPGDNVIINNDVVMDDTYTVGGYWSVNGGNITINASGSFVEGANVIGISIQNGGTITNNGTFNFDRIGIYQGSFTNNGTANFDALIYNLDIIKNYGNILQVDSFYTSGYYTNYANSVIESDSIYNYGIFINEGTVSVTEMFNDSSYTNNGVFNFNRYYNNNYFINNDTINSTLDATNAGYWYNAYGAVINLDNNFTNGNTSNAYHTAVFVNNGDFFIGNSWHNADTTKGTQTGRFVVQNGSYNSGVMIGNFDFCDQTPIVSSAPFIDYNTGTVDANITYCAVGIKNNISYKIKIFPNPALDIINIKTNYNLYKKIDIYNILGKKVLSKTVNKNNNIYKLNIKQLKKGIYFIKIQTGKSIIIKKIIKD